VLKLPDAWLWDFWFARQGDVHHVFYLQASRALQDPDRRHLRACIGHSTSTDLRSWTRQPDALVHGDAPAFDQTATWTGSVVQGPDGRWYLFYTGLERTDRGLRQQIALAISADLTTWERFGDRPVAVADPRWYSGLADSPQPWQDEHWRDPWVFADPGGDGWHMLITARANHGPHDERGVIGHARSRDLLTWTVQPPLTEPGLGFGQLEVPQVAVVDGQAALVFSCLGAELRPRMRQQSPTGGTWAVAVASLTGPYPVQEAVPLTDDSLYSGRLVQDGAGDWQLVAFHNRSADGRFIGELSDPMPVTWAVRDGEPTRRVLAARTGAGPGT